MGILVYVARTTLGDCTAGGISSTNDTLCVENINGPFNKDQNGPALYLTKGFQGTVKLITQRELDTGNVGMFGGNFASSSDSRFSKAVEKVIGQRFHGAVAIHDRFED